MREFDLIARIRQRAAARGDVVLGIGDDCALLAPPPGLQLAVTMDTLNVGVHFPPQTAAIDIGWKALAVNLSDLAAMGAQPTWGTLSLSLPAAEDAFVDAFIDGFLALAQAHEFALIGGDTTHGPLSISITAMGLVEPGQALRRDGAQAGDELWVSGSLGDAGGALRQWQSGGARCPQLQARLDRPTPRVALGRALRGIASSAIDLSDGLLADLGHVCRASGIGATIEIEELPASAALRAAFDAESRLALQAAGGDDYELCFSAPVGRREAVLALAAELDLPLTRIGRIEADAGIRCRRADGSGWQAPRQGFEHFDDGAA